MPHLTCSLFQSPSLLSFSRFHFVSLRFPHSLGLPVSLTAMCCMQICYCVCPCFVWVVWAGTAGHGGSVACTAASQQEGHGFDSRMGCCWLWGSGPGGLSPRPFCVKFACFPRVHRGFPPLRTPTGKTCKRTEHSSSVPDQDRRFTSPGPRALKKKAAHCSWGPGGGTVRDGMNSQTTSGLCVTCVASMYVSVSLF